MLWLIRCAIHENRLIRLFKYILCYGSSRRPALELSEDKNLNTSYVMVHPHIKISFLSAFANLNTSYVMVHPNGSERTEDFCLNLNTSYVMVHLDCHLILTLNNLLFKYILCYGSS